MTYQECYDISKKFYDTLDIKKDFHDFCELFDCTTVDLKEFMTMLEARYTSKLPPEFKGEFFNFINIDDFANYLHYRYGWRVKELEPIVITRYFITE